MQVYKYSSYTKIKKKKKTNDLTWFRNVIHKLAHYVARWIVIGDDHNPPGLAFHHSDAHGFCALPHHLSEVSCNQKKSIT